MLQYRNVAFGTDESVLFIEVSLERGSTVYAMYSIDIDCVPVCGEFGKLYVVIITCVVCTCVCLCVSEFSPNFN